MKEFLTVCVCRLLLNAVIDELRGIWMSIGMGCPISSDPIEKVPPTAPVTEN